MSLFQSHAGFCITRNKFQLVEIDFDNEQFYLENVDEELFDDAFDSSVKEQNLINILQTSFDKLSARKTLNCQHVSVALHHNFFKIVELPYDETLTRTDLNEHFNWELKQLFPSEISSNYFIQFIEVDKSNIRNDKSVLLIAADKRMLNIVHKFCLKNKMTMKIADNMHFATNIFLPLDNRSVKNEVFLSLMINPNDISMMVIDEDKPVYFSVKHFTGQSEIIPLIEDGVHKLGRFDLSLDSITKCYLFGDNVSDDLTEQINSQLSISLKKINPFDNIKVKPHIYENKFFIEQYNSFASATGIALRLQ